MKQEVRERQRDRRMHVSKVWLRLLLKAGATRGVCCVCMCVCVGEESSSLALSYSIYVTQGVQSHAFHVGWLLLLCLACCSPEARRRPRLPELKSEGGGCPPSSSVASFIRAAITADAVDWGAAGGVQTQRILGPVRPDMPPAAPAVELGGAAIPVGETRLGFDAWSCGQC